MKKHNFALRILIVTFSVRDVLASRHTTVVRTYSPFAEYFGRYDGVIYYSIQMASGIVHGRDVLAKEYRGQQSWGAVRLGCKSNGVWKDQGGPFTNMVKIESQHG